MIDPIADADAFKAKNPDVYQTFALWGLEDRKHDERPSIGLYFELARRPWMAKKLGLRPMDRQVKLNNNLRSGVSRLLNKEYNLGFRTHKSWAEKVG